jgi:chromosome segregation ATPase
MPHTRPRISAVCLAALLAPCLTAPLLAQTKLPQSDPSKNPKAGSNYVATVQKQIDDLKPQVDQVNQMRDKYKADYDAAAAEVKAAQEKLNTRRAAVVSAQTKLAAARAELKAKLKDQPDVVAADKAIKEAQAEEVLARSKAEQSVVDSKQYKQLVSLSEEVKAALKKAHDEKQQNPAFIDSASTQLTAYTQQMGQMKAKAITADADYIEAARKTRAAMDEAAKVRRKLEAEFDKQPSVTDAWTNITSAQKEVGEA